MARYNLKYKRQRREYDRQCARLQHYEARFRKIARKQVQERALRKLGQSPADAQGDATNRLVQQQMRRGVKSLQMTPELCGLFDQVNRIRSMLYMTPHAHGYELLLR